MPEKLQQLNEALDKLEAELAVAGQLDDRRRELLAEAKADVQRAIESEDPQDLKSKGWFSQIEESAEEFEASHPQLSLLFNRIVNAFAQLGI